MLISSKIPNNFYRTAIKGLVLDKDKRFLLCKGIDGFWDLPGGAMNFGEDYKATLEREVLEEMGLKIKAISKTPCYFLSFISVKKVWATNIIFLMELNSLNFTPSSECVEIKFFSKEEALKEKLFPSIIMFAKEYDSKRH